jgi:NADH dehydrogenase
MYRGVVTVFGASGFLGRHLVQRLARQGYRIRAAVRHPGTAHFLRPMGETGQIQPIQANIRSDTSVRRLVEGAEAVINLVGILHERGRQSFQALHVDGAARIAAHAQASGVQRLVHVSALGADPHSPSAYARSKAAGEAALRERFADAIILRPSILFGPEDTFFNRFAAMARVSPALPLIGGGHTRLQPLFVGDAAEAARRALEQPDAPGHLFELGGPQIYTLREVLELVLRVTERRRLLLPVPFWAARMLGQTLGLLPNPPLTMEQVRLLERDNIVAPDAADIRTLGIEPVAAEVMLPTYLFRYRKPGSFEMSGITGA